MKSGARATPSRIGLAPAVALAACVVPAAAVVPGLGERPPSAGNRHGMFAASKARRWEEAFSILHRMRAAALQLDDTVCGSAMRACRGGGPWQRALSLLRDMQGSSLQPAQSCYNGALTAWVQGLGVEMSDVATMKEQLEGPIALLDEALEGGVFAGWVTQNAFDLHGMHAEAAKVAVFSVMCDILILPPEHKRLQGGLSFTVGKRLGSEGPRVIAPLVHKLLRSHLFQCPVKPLCGEGWIELEAKRMRRAQRLPESYFATHRLN